MIDFTPGPWFGQESEALADPMTDKQVADALGRSAVVRSASGDWVADVGDWRDAERRANAELIGAAPEMFAILTSLVSACGQSAPPPLLDEARKVLRKASGRIQR